MVSSAPRADVTEAPPEERPKRETWRDWMPEGIPDPPLISREEVLVELKEQHSIELPVRMLRFWESAGAVPHAVRQWHKDAVHAVYPIWYPSVLRTLYSLRTDPLTKSYPIAHWRDYMLHHFRWVAEPGLRPIGGAEWAPEMRHRHGKGIPIHIAQAIFTLLEELRNEQVQDGGPIVTRAELRLYGQENDEAAYMVFHTP